MIQNPIVMNGNENGDSATFDLYVAPAGIGAWINGKVITEGNWTVGGGKSGPAIKIPLSDAAAGFNGANVIVIAPPEMIIGAGADGTRFRKYYGKCYYGTLAEGEEICIYFDID